MNSQNISILLDRADYEVCARAARLVRQATGKATPDTEALIRFQFMHRTADGLARDYLDCHDEIEARRKVLTPRKRKVAQDKSGQRPQPRQIHRQDRTAIIKSLAPSRPKDLSRN